MTDTNIEGQNATKSTSQLQKYSLNLSEQMSALVEITEKYKAVADNPVMISQIFLGITNAFDTFNKLLFDLNKVLMGIEARLAELESISPSESIELTKIDQEVLDYVMTKERVTAEDVQKKFGYSGKNAASARLHRLYVSSKLQKIQAGRTVYYTAPKSNP